MSIKKELTAEQALESGKKAAKSGDKKKAENYFKAVLKTYPDNDDAIKAIQALYPNSLFASDLAELKDLLKKHNYKEVEIRGKMYLDLYTDVFELYYYVAISLGAQGKHEEALPYFKRAAEINPKDVNAQFNLGNAFQAVKEYKLAIDSYIRTTTLNPEYSLAHNNAGKIFMILKDYDNAIEAFDTATKLSPGVFDMHANAGDAYKAKGNYEKAIYHYRIAAELDKRVAQVLNDLGLCYHYTGNNDEAIKIFETIIKQAPDFTDAKTNLDNVLKSKEKMH